MKAIAPESINLSDLPSIPFESRSHLPKCAGIYIVLNEFSKVLYVERSINIRARWTSHHKRKELQALNGIKIAWFQVADVPFLPILESAFISRFNPELNFPSPGFWHGQPLKQFRIEAGLRTVDIAFHLGVADSSVRNWESGRTVPILTFAQMRQLMQLYLCSFEELEEAIKQSMICTEEE